METEATVSEFQNMLSARGVSRRSFMKLCGAVAVAAGLSELAAPRVAQALEKSVIGATKGKLYPVIWIDPFVFISYEVGYRLSGLHVLSGL